MNTVYATQNDASNLMLQGALALSKVQSSGMKIDLAYCYQAQKDIVKEMLGLEDQLSDMEETKLLKDKYGSKYKLKSDDQLRWLLFDHFGLEASKQTTSGQDSTDAEALEDIIWDTDSEFLKKLLLYKKLDKANGTYLHNIILETNERGFLHPFFHLHLAISYRSSSSMINFQNIPTRDPKIKGIIRKAFIPRKGRQIMELDFKGIEVSVAYEYHKDPTMRSYLLDPTKDMHRDMAQQLYKLNDKEWNKPCRQGAKNQFVFPSFYGSYFKQTALGLWKYAKMNDLRVGKNSDGVSIIEHLKKKGIRDYEAYESYVQKIEDDFWNNRFPVYTKWKEEWVEKYHEKAYFDSLTGFRYYGIFSRNQTINLAVQGSAFHCLLFTLIQLNNWLIKNKMKSLIIGQIHDSMVLDVVPEERDAIIEFVQYTIRNTLPGKFKWIELPMTIEGELAGVDEPWLNKKEITLH